ncbi:MAG: iron ABC transporter [Candidatus Amoebophilus sp. 36-38]|nr:MAG: iron ABC transporter [Candidatus Amoebophilus sp. 36-38]
METFWILLVASLAAVNCSLVGTYLVLRKITMMADAITHAVLPGIVLAFLFTGSKSSLVVLLGAGSTGILASLLVAFLHKKVKLQSDASIGINFTWLFALGIILVSLFSRKIDLDPDCVLYGEVAYTPFNVWYTASGINMGPQALYTLGFVLLLNLSFILLGYKQLAITIFDSDFATTIGIRTSLWHYLLMTATSFTAVASFEVAGAILVVALFVVPASIAYLLTYKLSHMLLLGSLIGIIVTVVGYFLAIWLKGSISGAMVTVAGGLFFFTWLFKRYQSQTKRLVHKKVVIA